MDTITLKSIVMAYATRIDASKWGMEDEYNAADEPSGSICNMNLQTFARHFYVPAKGKHRNKIQHRSNDDTIPIFFPRKYQHPADQEKYAGYCKFALMRFKPWEKCPSNLWGGVVDPSGPDLIRRWMNVLKELKEQGREPDGIRRRMDEFFRDQQAIARRVQRSLRHRQRQRQNIGGRNDGDNEETEI